MAYNRYNSKRLVLLKNTEPGIFESVRALLEKNQPSTSIHLAFLSCSRGDVFRKRRRFMSHRQLAEKQIARKLFGDEAEEYSCTGAKLGVSKNSLKLALSCLR